MPGIGASEYAMIGAAGDLGIDLALAAQQNTSKVKKKKQAIASGAADELGLQ